MNGEQIIEAIQKYEAKKILAEIRDGRINLFPNPTMDLKPKVAFVPIDPSLITVIENQTLSEAVTRALSRILRIRPQQITNVTLEQTYEQVSDISTLKNYGSYARPVTQARVEYRG